VPCKINDLPAGPGHIVLSPDGARVVFVVRGADGGTRLMTRKLEQPAPVVLAGTEGARSPFMSPDGRWVGFWAGGALKKTSVDGGSPVQLCETPDLHGASWDDSGEIVAAFGAGALLRVPSTAGTPAIILDLTPEGGTPRWPQVLPGGQHILFTAVGPSGPNAARIEVLSIADGRRTVVVQGGTYGRYLTDGYLTYVNQGTLFAVPFDAHDHERQRRCGAGRRVLFVDVRLRAPGHRAQRDTRISPRAARCGRCLCSGWCRARRAAADQAARLHVPANLTGRATAGRCRDGDRGVFGRIQQMHFANIAARGARSWDLRDHQVPQAVCAASVQRPTIVTITAGANDFFAGDQDIFGIALRVVQAIDLLLNNGGGIVPIAVLDPFTGQPCPPLANVTILVSNYYHIPHPVPAVQAQLDAALQGFDFVLRTLLPGVPVPAGSRIALVDLYTPSLDRQGLVNVERRLGFSGPLDFDVHPTNLGHTFIAREFERAWRELP
jgi:hypothetical protein